GRGQGAAGALGGGLGARGGGGRKLVGRQPGAVVTPQAWAVGHLDRLPGLRIDGTPAPAVLDHELVGRAGVKRGHVIVGAAAEGGGDAPRLGRGDIVGLADVVEAHELQHDVVDAAAGGFDHGQAVMAWVDVEEVCLEGPQDVVAEAEAEHVLVEPEEVLDAPDVEDDVAHAERAGTESRDRPARHERYRRGFRAVEGLKPRTRRIGECDAGVNAAQLCGPRRDPLDGDLPSRTTFWMAASEGSTILCLRSSMRNFDA